MLEKPTDGREVVCHASAWDFYNRKDFRCLLHRQGERDGLPKGGGSQQGIALFCLGEGVDSTW